MKRRLLSNVLKYGIGIALLAYVIWRNWSAPPGSNGIGLADALAKPVQLGPLIWASLLFFVALLLTFLRWYVLVRAQDLPFTLFNAVRLGLVGFFFSTFLPGSIGGDIIKAAFIAREQKRRTVSVSTVLLDRALGLWGLVWLVALSGGVFWIFGSSTLHEDTNLQRIVLGAAVIVAVTLSLWFLLSLLPVPRVERFAGRLRHIPQVGHIAAECWRAVWLYSCKGRSIAGALVLSMGSCVSFVLAFYFAAQMFQDPDQPVQIPSLTEHFLLVPIGMTVQALFPSPGGVGGGEYSFGKLYALVGRPEANGVLASLAQRVITWGLSLLGYFIYLRMRPALRRVAEKPVDLAAVET